jgi:hypothetical protein
MSALSRSQLRTRYRELRDLMSVWDPIGVMDDPEWPRDEYDGLVGPVLRRLEAGEAIEALSVFLETEVRAHFGVEPVPGAARAFAERAVAWYRQRWPGTGPVPSDG